MGIYKNTIAWEKRFIGALKGRKYKTDDDDRRQDAQTIILEQYSQLKSAVELGNLDSIPHTLAGAFRPVNNPFWEEQAHLMMKILIEDVTKTQLPILDGSIDEIPLQVYDRHRTKDRAESRKIFLSLETDTEEETSSKEEKLESQAQERWKLFFKVNQSLSDPDFEKKAIWSLDQERLKQQVGINQLSSAEELFKWISAKYKSKKQTATIQKVLKSFELFFSKRRL